jgi:poly(3-hydroxybutyrate) depolymerase
MRNFKVVRLSIAVTVVMTLLAAPVGAAPDPAASAEALATLKTVLAHKPASLAALADQPFARIALTRTDAAIAHTLIWTAQLDDLRKQRAREVASRVIRDGDLAMPFTFKVFGARPARGHSLWISLHGGGGIAHEGNDEQWANQQSLYQLDEGYYVTPRAPIDAWNMWTQASVDRMLVRLIEDMIAVHGVDPDRVYLLGYGAGGDGVYQLAPRMADAWAGAAMMAGHPNGGTPITLRNVAFAVQVGALDTAYDRNKAAQEYGVQLDKLRAADPGGYAHFVKLHPDKGPWMDREDAVALPWLAGFRRNARPDRVVWKQDGVVHDRSYWLAVPPGEARGGALVIATQRGGHIAIETADKIGKLLIRLDDQMADLDGALSVSYRGKPLVVGPATRTIRTMLETLADRGDPALMFDAEITVELPSGPK